MKGKTLILDYSTWRCGGRGGNTLGRGSTLLRNTLGFQCCLGQFSCQLEPKTLRKRTNHGTPSDTGVYIPILTTQRANGNINDTAISTRAIKINDNEKTTPEEKIERLKALFGRVGYKIKVINKP